MSSSQERSAAVVAGLDAIGLDYILHLPSSTLAGVLRHFDEGNDQPSAQAGTVYPMHRLF